MFLADSFSLSQNGLQDDLTKSPKAGDVDVRGTAASAREGKAKGITYLT
jgi:hypothetical protein